MYLAALENKLTEMLAPSVEALGFELFGIEYIRAGKNSILRIYIDHEKGIHVDDCALVSRQVSAILDVEDPISEQYVLEVSSPGIESPLFTLEHYQKFQGEEVQVKLKMPIQGSFNLKGEIASVEENQVTLETLDRGQVTLFLDNIRKANLVVRF